ncbi:SDR family oxidoreductase [Halovulum dunhuangense]|uniref:SDR family oxidoreductase n=1 Tax=Halovulum dunhuangense TaxID=1505036 RepID=A0A849KXP5_9RHOB|nr:SDR family oxidoreductase [Halovulum dunhuangense]NNU79397.1 SDR family oxidoreductase [Halovulum dunhuangense]
MTKRRLLCLGFGYTAQVLARALPRDAWDVTGTTRDPAGLDRIAAQGVEPLLWPGSDPGPALSQATHVLSSVPPREAGDPAHDLLSAHPGQMPRLEWVGLLSTTGVYGDHGGDWVDEETPLVPATHRGGLRAVQNDAWLRLWSEHGLPVHIFRLAGIYGPGRSALDRLRDGTAQRIVKPGQVFSRIHVEDIVQVLLASIARPHPGRAYNVADDEPGPPQDVIEHAAKLLGLPVPPDIPFDQADLSPMARSFYADNKRVRNDRIKAELGVRLAYPTYRDGLAAILAAERQSGGN